VDKGVRQSRPKPTRVNGKMGYLDKIKTNDRVTANIIISAPINLRYKIKIKYNSQ
jgi:hypothetical protein